MSKIRKNDMVCRKSYGGDILFSVERIIKTSRGKEYAILKGVTIRIEADAPIEDLESVEKRVIENNLRSLEKKMEKRIRKQKEKPKIVTTIKRGFSPKPWDRTNTGKILHLDGDKRYSEKSERYYKKMGLQAVVKNVKENKQPLVIGELLRKYNPDILVMTGHDGMIKDGVDYNNIYNYRNSRHFIRAVQEAKKYAQEQQKDLVIFAGACQSYFEAIMEAGANFASSPARILIDFMDPLIVAEKIATTENYKYVTVYDFVDELRDGTNGVGGRGARGKKILQNCNKNVI